MSRLRAGAADYTTFFAVTLLAIEFLDEFVFGIREAAWPLIRTDLGLDYARIGLLLGVPGIPVPSSNPSSASWATCGAAACSSWAAVPCSRWRCCSQR